ncbi:hypothetical protein BDW72DRAFT_195971 [Aspergillus terricola var. indicus]
MPISWSLAQAVRLHYRGSFSTQIFDAAGLPFFVFENCLFYFFSRLIFPILLFTISAQGPSGGGGPPADDYRPNVSRLRGPRVSLLDEYQAILQSLGIPRYATPAQIFAHDEDNLQRALRVLAGFLEGLQRRPSIPESFRAEVELIRNRVLLRLVEIRAHHLSVAYNIPRVPDFERDFLGRFELHQIDILHEYVLNTNTSMRCLPRNMVPDALFYFVNTVLEYCNDVYSGLGVSLENGGPQW